MKKTLSIFCAAIVFPAILSAQSKTNFEKFFQLIDNSIVKTSEVIGKTNSLALSVTGPSSLELLKPKVFESFAKNGYKIKDDNSADAAKLNYSINQAVVEYGEAEKDGFFGDVISERKVMLRGIITLTDGSVVKSIEINESQKDTVVVDDIRNLEDATVQFTQGNKPEVTLFSNLLEPVLVVGTLITTIVLLFTVRGK